jgi:predicted HicB family RNase H-like nuclease
MGILSLRLPESLHKQVRELVTREGISIDQFIHDGGLPRRACSSG